jgi:hypothetical protein
MGYSCSAKARFTFDAITKLVDFCDDKETNKYWLDIGRENFDGSITGKVYEFCGITYKDKDGYNRRPCREKGNFKIDKNGIIIRFPGLAKGVWELLQVEGNTLYKREYLGIGRTRHDLPNCLN